MGVHFINKQCLIFLFLTNDKIMYFQLYDVIARLVDVVNVISKSVKDCALNMIHI